METLLRDGRLYTYWVLHERRAHFDRLRVCVDTARALGFTVYASYLKTSLDADVFRADGEYVGTFDARGGLTFRGVSLPGEGCAWPLCEAVQEALLLMTEG